MRSIPVVVMLIAAACGPSAGAPASTVGATGAPSLSGGAAPRSTATPTPVPTLPKTGRVDMGDNFFQPDEVVVAVGATVTWEIVMGDARHDVVSVDGLFHSSSPMNRGDLFTFTFTAPGEYKYICSYHTIEGMGGKVVVK
ncbi:MAG TPA: plastocyanin/azurin family copper-binding protein [Candidatus Limnocylindria bacterium]|nr:plastocyanin/azurin family copper-binding protein [Candidatus Limnocylindria bacterium]